MPPLRKRIRKGLDLPIAGLPDQQIELAPSVTRVALLGADYIGMKPTMQVAEGDEVKLGQVLFTDKRDPDIKYTSPGAGKVVAVNRGEKRVFQSIVIELAGDAQETFASHSNENLATLDRDVVRSQLLESGLWTALRVRPYSKVASPSTSPRSIFVQAIDTNPLAADPQKIIQQHPALFRYGLQVLTRLTEGPVYVCHAPEVDLGLDDIDRVTPASFDGPHPAGLPGTHIHMLDPVSEQKLAWYINCQDVIAIGQLFVSGELMTERVVSLGGPQVNKPRLLKTRLGACLDELCQGELKDGDNRVISGSVFAGRHACEPFNFLGRYHYQVSVLLEGRDREFLGWQKPGSDKFSVKPVFVSALAADGRRFPFTTNTNGSPRAMVPIGLYEKVMPLDVEPTFLLRSLLTGDIEQARLLGALELDEEDLALCTYVDPGKEEYGPLLRRTLTQIEREG